MTRHDSIIYFQHMLENAEKVQTFSTNKTRENFDEDEVLRFALMYAVQTIGEAARNIPATMQERYLMIPWKRIMGMRHRIVHGYAEIDADIVWETIVNDVPILIRELRKILNDE